MPRLSCSTQSRSVYSLSVGGLSLLAWVAMLTGCGSSLPTQHTIQPAPSPTSPTLSATVHSQDSWATLLPGESAHGVTFDAEGSLKQGNKEVLEDIPVTYVSDGSAVYAQRLIVSPPSPSGNFHFLKGCETAIPDQGLCWAVFLMNKANGTAYPVTVGKYGGENWVQWSADDRYAVLVEILEGSAWIYVVDLQTEASRHLGEMSVNVDLDSFQWTGDRTFTIRVDGSPIEADIATLF
jgi:hypothetical protein